MRIVCWRRWLLVLGLSLGACQDGRRSSTDATIDPSSGLDAGRASRPDAAIEDEPEDDAPAEDRMPHAEGGLDDGGTGAAADAALAPGERAHDRRSFSIAPISLAFGPVAEGIVTHRFSGVLDGAGYRIEVPAAWNGTLVVYAHDYQGNGRSLAVRTPAIRRHLIERGYAWAASSYRSNYYDARAAVEDSNALALAFTRIARENGHALAEPSKRYILGHGLGGHAAAAAVERETLETARAKVRYDGALPMCGALGDVALFSYFAAYQAAAHALAGEPFTMFPEPAFERLRSSISGALFVRFPRQLTPAGERLKALVMHLTGGPRPAFEAGFALTSEHDKLWNAFVGDGWIDGIVVGQVADTRDVVYQLDGDSALSADERALNASITRIAPDPLANPPRADGVRWIPQLHGELEAPVLTLHGLGDVLVPFSMQQIYLRRVLARGAGERLVQRAIRATGHCDFSLGEQVAAFDALVAWDQQGLRPDGDDVLDAALVASPSYGCKFTLPATSEDLPDVQNLRQEIPACAPSAP